MKSKEEMIETMAEAYYKASMEFDHKSDWEGGVFDTSLLYRVGMGAALKALCGALPDQYKVCLGMHPPPRSIAEDKERIQNFKLMQAEIGAKFYNQLKQWGK